MRQYLLGKSTLSNKVGALYVVATPIGNLDQIEAVTDGDESAKMAYRGGVVWARAGLELNRPSYQVSPYVAAPVKQWASGDVEGSKSRLHIGFRFMLR